MLKQVRENPESTAPRPLRFSRGSAVELLVCFYPESNPKFVVCVREREREPILPIT